MFNFTNMLLNFIKSIDVAFKKNKSEIQQWEKSNWPKFWKIKFPQNYT